MNSIPKKVEGGGTSLARSPHSFIPPTISQGAPLRQMLFRRRHSFRRRFPSRRFRFRSSYRLRGYRRRRY